jgi:type IX secretion system PorP/SprF family membrane protein
MKAKILVVGLMLIGFATMAQQDAQYTQYMYNTININPAYAGSREVLSIFGLYRTQWVGIDGAPVTNNFSVNSPIKNSNLGMGLSFVNDQIGPTSEYILSGDISYTIKTSATYKLSFGTKVTANIFEFDKLKLSPEVQNNPDLQNVRNNFSPNIGAGIYFHSDKLYFGASVPNFIETNRFSDDTYYINKERMHIYFIGGYVFDLSESVKFKPAFLTKMIAGAPLQLDVSANALIHNRFVIGAAWRWDAAVSGMAGFQINKEMFIGYAYDVETTRLRSSNSGSHEIFIRFELARRTEKIIPPRFF